MKKLNIVSDLGDLRILGGDIFLSDEKVVSEDQETYATLKDLEENLVLRNWNIWPRVFIYDNCLYYNFKLTFRFPPKKSNGQPNPINPQIYSNYSYLSSVKFSTARKLTTKKLSESETSTNNGVQYTPFVLLLSSSEEQSSQQQLSSSDAPQLGTPRLTAPSRGNSSASINNDTPTTIDFEQTSFESNKNYQDHAVVGDKNFNIKYSSIVVEEIINGERVTFNELYSEIMNLVDSESSTGISMYYNLSSLYDLIKKSGVVEIITPGSPVYTSAINLSKYVRDNCICHVTVSYLSENNTEGLGLIKFSPCQLNSDGELKPLSERFEIMDNNLDTICVIECLDFCVRVFPENTDECVITNCYITYEN